MQRYLAHASLQVVGVSFVTVGVAGLFLPFLQGILLMVIGLYLMSFSFASLRRFIDRRLEPYPRLSRVCRRVDIRVKRIFRLP